MIFSSIPSLPLGSSIPSLPPSSSIPSLPLRPAEGAGENANHIDGVHIKQKSLAWMDFNRLFNEVSARRQDPVRMALVRQMFETSDTYIVSRLRHDEHDPRWIITAIKATEANITPWVLGLHVQDRVDHIADIVDQVEYKETKSRALRSRLDIMRAQLHRSIERTVGMIDIYRDFCLYLLEGSEFLKNSTTAQERHVLQNWLSQRAEYAGYFTQALQYIDGKEHIMFIDRLLDNMKKSGFVYHPHKQFQIMMNIFKICPKIVNQKMGDIFDALFGWNRINWMNEPFRSAFVDTLQIMIADNREHIDEVAGIEDKDDNNSFTKMVQALATQLMLTESGELPKLELNRAILYRSLMLLPGVDRAHLVEKALATLCHQPPQTLEYVWQEANQPSLLGYKLSASDAELPSAMMPLRFVGEKAQLVIDPHQIVIEPVDATSMAHPVLPAALLPWHNMQVRLYGDVETPPARKMRDLERLRRMWEQIESALLGQEQPIQAFRKVDPEPGDSVLVKIDDVELDDSQSLHCTIVDDEFEGEGWMHMRDIAQWVSYDPPLRFFRDGNGNLLLYEVTVVNRSENGDYRFSMVKEIERYNRDTVRVGDEVVAVVTAKNSHNQYTLLTIEGFSMWADAEGEFSSLPNSTFVHARVTEVRKGNSIYGEVVRLGDDLDRFAHDAPFRNLMQNIGRESDNPEVLVEQHRNYSALEPNRMHELILLVRRVALALPDDYVGTFNYLCMARLMAVIAREQNQVEILDRHLKLLSILAAYDQNGTISPDSLTPYADDTQNPTLKRLGDMLSLVAGIDHPTDDGRIWEQTKSAIPAEADLARLVLSLKLLGNDVVAQQQSAVKSRILEILRVNNHNDQAKYYGSESFHTEFKTSIIFPPENGMQRDVEQQTRNIMRVVCGFLNADGGTLYLGVRDNGFANGLKLDMEWFKSRDKFDLHVRNSVHDLLGTTANNYVAGKWDDGTDREVYVLAIKACPHLVSLDGAVWVRQGTSTRLLEGEDLENYKQDRNRLFAKKKTERPAVVAEVRPAPAAPARQRSEEPVVPYEAPVVDDRPRAVATSVVRNNVLHDYQEGYTPDIDGYIYFRPENRFEYSPNDIYAEAESELAIALHEGDDAGYMVMVYDNANVVRVAMHEITDKAPGRTYNYGHQQTLFFAAPAQPDDALLMIMRDGKNNYVFRAQPLADIEEDHINATGQRLFDVECNEILRCEIIPAGKTDLFADGLALSRRLVGYNLRRGPQETFEQAIDRFVGQISD